jgi:HEPN domain-containing protein
MSAAEPVIEITRAWWEKAAEDLEAAKLSRHLPTASSFHCQQAVEKAIKALLILHQVKFEKTHEIGRLLELLRKAPAAPPSGLTEDLDELSLRS